MVVSMMSVMGVASASAYDTFGELDAAIRAGGTITLDDDFTYSGSLYVPAGKTVTLDLAGHKIESTNDCAIKSVGTLTIKDTVGGGEVVAQECCVLATSNAKTTINSGTFTAKDNAVFMGNGTPGEGGCTWYIKGGTFNASIQTPGYTACGIYAPNDDTWNISGGTFNVTNGVGICQRAGTVKVTGGSFNVTGDGTLGKVGDSKVVVPSGTAVVYDSKAKYPAQTDETDKTTVTGGTFNTEKAPVAQVKADGDATRVTVSGGTFHQDISAYVNDSTNNIVNNGDGTFSVAPEAGSICEVGGKGYDNLDAAIAEAIASGNTINLLAACNSAPNNQFSKLNITGSDPVTFKVYGNGFYGASFANKTDIANGPYVNTWTIIGTNKNATYTYTINPATVMVENNGVITYPTSLYDAFGTTGGRQVKDGGKVTLLANIDLDANKSEIPVTANNVTLDLNGKNITTARDNALEVKGGNTITIENGEISSTTGKTALKVDAASLVNLDNIYASNVAADEGAKFTFANGAAITGDIDVPDNCTVVENTDGSKTIVDNSNPLNALETLEADGNQFGINCGYLKGTLLGVQKKDKSEVGAPDTSEGGQETGCDLRFIAVLDTQLIQELQDADDYGFVLAKVNKSKNTSSTNFDNLKAFWGNGEKTISAKGTYNNVCGDEAYGNPYNDSTRYKYITCAVNGIVKNSSKIAARFWYKKDGKIYYAKYAGQSFAYTGCTAGFNTSGNVI